MKICDNIRCVCVEGRGGEDERGASQYFAWEEYDNIMVHKNNLSLVLITHQQYDS